MLVSEHLSQGEGPTSPVGSQHTPTVIETSPQLQNIFNTYRKTKTRIRRMGIRIPQPNVPSSVEDEAITKEMHDRLRRATTTASPYCACHRIPSLTLKIDEKSKARLRFWVLVV
uniref:Uncharacterized protein n=1 Tax=Tanacetum cinerariifolium TaxID=118510 RepID=A0A699JS60_TANCI|nr:hypothetical protein [Tanacetum cinerariifolium]